MKDEAEKLVQALNKYFEGHELKRKDALDAATMIIVLTEKLENEYQHRIYAEEHADAFLEDCQNLSLELENIRKKAKIIIETDQWGVKHKKCSFCEKELGWGKTNYCFNCGAKLV